MTRNRRDAAPENIDRKRAVDGASGEPVSAAQVANYLCRHPDFFHRNPELLDGIQAPARDRGEGVIDLQQYMVEHLRDELVRLAAARDELVVTGRNNLSAQTRVHQAVLVLLAATSFEHFVETLTTDLAIILDLDVVTMGVEQNGQDVARAQTAGVYSLEPDMVDRLIGPGQTIALRETVEGDPAIFGPAAGLVASDALLRLSIGGMTPAAMLALGSREPGQFHPGQGTELLNFLARVVETRIRRWLHLPE